jgi:hypothetical protein
VTLTLTCNEHFVTLLAGAAANSCSQDFKEHPFCQLLKSHIMMGYASSFFGEPEQTATV